MEFAPLIVDPSRTNYQYLLGAQLSAICLFPDDEERQEALISQRLIESMAELCPEVEEVPTGMVTRALAKADDMNSALDDGAKRLAVAGEVGFSLLNQWLETNDFYFKKAVEEAQEYFLRARAQDGTKANASPSEIRKAVDRHYKTLHLAITYRLYSESSDKGLRQTIIEDVFSFLKTSETVKSLLMEMYETKEAKTSKGRRKATRDNWPDSLCPPSELMQVPKVITSLPQWRNAKNHLQIHKKTDIQKI